IGGTERGKENSRVLIMQMVNSLTSKLQIGSPMAALYLLGNPDHYTNMSFKVFWWKSYVSEVNRSWPLVMGESGMPVDHDREDAEQDRENGDETDRVVLIKSNEGYVGTTNVDDYKYRSLAFENTSLYEYFQMATRKKRTKKQMVEFLTSLEEKPGIDVDMPDIRIPGPDDDDWIDHDLDEAGTEEAVGDRSDAVSAHPFQPEHELFKTHYVRCDRRALETTVPNFVGGPLPRVDQGDREFYCCTMLTLFKPWRTGKDLKNDLDNWDESFTDYNFNEKATQLMKNFNVRYECNDARDDFAAQDRQKRRAMPMFSRWTKEGDEDDDNTTGWDYGEVMDEVTDNHIIPGPRYLAKEESMRQAEEVMIKSGWTQRRTGSLVKLPARFIPKKQLSGNQWKIRINLEKQTALAAKLKNAPAFGKQRKPPKKSDDPGNDINLLNSYYFTKYFKAKEKKAQKVVTSVATSFKLNKEQKRAFKLVTNHAIAEDPEPLRMYLGGVGGTGKSQVIKALINFFEERGESHRFTVLAPTGAAAALLNGST
ncbi:hypothetical protein B0H17DRAFT_867553, partial [Mycena rosella]